MAGYAELRAHVQATLVRARAEAQYYDTYAADLVEKDQYSPGLALDLAVLRLHLTNVAFAARSLLEELPDAKERTTFPKECTPLD